jgi:hypothetical protein
MMKEKTANRDDEQETEPSAFERFEQFARKIIAVSKREIDTAKEGENGPPPDTEPDTEKRGEP